MAEPRNEIIFVCTGNTCRSPMAAALFRHALKAQEEPLNSLVVSSAGVSAYGGQPASANSVDALKKVGIDLADHRSQPISQEQVDRALAFFCMTDSHLAMLSYQIDPPPANAFLMRQFMPEDSGLEIPDPFGMTLVHYEACRDSMVEAIPSLIQATKEIYAHINNSDTEQSEPASE